MNSYFVNSLIKLSFGCELFYCLRSQWISPNGGVWRILGGPWRKAFWSSIQAVEDYDRLYHVSALDLHSGCFDALVGCFDALVGYGWPLVRNSGLMQKLHKEPIFRKKSYTSHMFWLFFASPSPGITVVFFSLPEKPTKKYQGFRTILTKAHRSQSSQSSFGPEVVAVLGGSSHLVSG